MVLLPRFHGTARLQALPQPSRSVDTWPSAFQAFENGLRLNVALSRGSAARAPALAACGVWMSRPPARSFLADLAAERLKDVVNQDFKQMSVSFSDLLKPSSKPACRLLERPGHKTVKILISFTNPQPKSEVPPTGLAQARHARAMGTGESVALAKLNIILKRPVSSSFDSEEHPRPFIFSFHVDCWLYLQDGLSV